MARLRLVSNFCLMKKPCFRFLFFLILFSKLSIHVQDTLPYQYLMAKPMGGLDERYAFELLKMASRLNFHLIILGIIFILLVISFLILFIPSIFDFSRLGYFKHFKDINHSFLDWINCFKLQILACCYFRLTFYLKLPS